jgi:hypothetical protein
MVFMLKKFKHRPRDISKEKKNEKKKRKQSIRLAMEGRARFFEKILPEGRSAEQATDRRWRFF